MLRDKAVDHLSEDSIVPAARDVGGTTTGSVVAEGIAVLILADRLCN